LHCNSGPHVLIRDLPNLFKGAGDFDDGATGGQDHKGILSPQNERAEFGTNDDIKKLEGNQHEKVKSLKKIVAHIRYPGTPRGWSVTISGVQKVTAIVVRVRLDE
jgi:hypothetical protein